MTGTKFSRIGFGLVTALAGTLTGCIGHVDGPRHARDYPPPPMDYVETEVITLQDDYVYYPDYQVYYRSNRRQYVFLDGNAWVSRPAPPRVSVEVLSASPSMQLDFHDSPSMHHAAVVRQYPKHWSPPGSSSNQ